MTNPLAEWKSRAKQRSWWNSRASVKELYATLGRPPDRERSAWLEELDALAQRIHDKRHEAAVHTESAHWFQRGSAGASAAVATLTGGALLGNLSGTAAHYVGVAAAVVGLATAAIAAARPGDSYIVDLARKAHYEQLWWDISTYALTQLAEADAAGFQAVMKDFAAREAAIMAVAPPGQQG